MGLPPGKKGPAMIHRIARAGNQGVVPGIDEGQGEVGDPLFRADQGHHLGLRIQGDVKTALIPGGHRVSKIIHPGIGGIAVVRGILARFHQSPQDVFRRGQVRVTDPQIDNIHPLGPDLGL